MKRSGKAHPLTVLGVLGVLAIGALLLFARESPEAAANKWLAALAKSDVETLVDLTYAPHLSRDDLRKQYDFAVNKAGRYYRFTWNIKHTKTTDDDNAVVTIGFVRNALSFDAYEDKFEIPMVKVQGRWKVDVAAVTSVMYPALPR